MNRKISKLIIALMAALFTWSTGIAQTKTMYIMKNGEIIYQIPVSDIDSIIFYNPDGIPDAKITSTCYVDRAAGFTGSFYNTEIINGKVEITGNNTSGTYTSVEFSTVNFTKLVGSWSVSHVDVSGSTVELEFRVKTTSGTWSSWLSYRQWGFERNSSDACSTTNTLNASVDATGGVARIVYDEIMNPTSSSYEYNTFQYRVTLRRSSGSIASPKIKAISASLYRSTGDSFGAPAAAKEWTDKLTGSDILNQLIVPSIGNSICSPTTITMLMRHKGITSFGGCTYMHEYTARKVVYDGRLFGNWTFCTSAMGSWGTTNYIAYPRHVYSANELAHLLTKGPVGASIQGNSTAGPLIDTEGITRYSGSGHLIVIRGFEMSGGVVSNFIISDPNGGLNYKARASNVMGVLVSKVAYVIE